MEPDERVVAVAPSDFGVSPPICIVRFPLSRPIAGRIVPEFPTRMRLSAWLHGCLALYVWVIESVPLGNWNRQRGERLFIALLHGHGADSDDVFTLVFVALPAILFVIANRRSSLWLATSALAVDVFWLWMHIRSWWVPYIFGTTIQWQIDYSKGPTTKILHSFGNHVAPDGMHLIIDILLIAAMVAGVFAVRQLVAIRTASSRQMPLGKSARA
jgi:hypothetical protein